MPALPLSVLVPGLVMIAGEALPAVAAWRAGRLRPTDPAGQVGITWAVMDGCNLLQYAGFATGHRALTDWSLTFAGVALPVLLAPPLLTWIGPRAKRWQPLALVAFAVLGIAPFVAFGPGRLYNLLSRTTAQAALSALVLLMMAAQHRRSANPQAWAAEPGWAWIASGMLAYFTTTLLGRPLIEGLIARGLGTASVIGSMIVPVVYALAMVAIAWGILRSARRRPDTGRLAGATPLRAA